MTSLLGGPFKSHGLTPARIGVIAITPTPPAWKLLRGNVEMTMFTITSIRPFPPPTTLVSSARMFYSSGGSVPSFSTNVAMTSAAAMVASCFIKDVARNKMAQPTKERAVSSAVLTWLLDGASDSAQNRREDALCDCQKGLSNSPSESGDFAISQTHTDWEGGGGGQTKCEGLPLLQVTTPPPLLQLPPPLLRAL